jgi:DNA-binding NarL/FixJ family response regulator
MANAHTTVMVADDHTLFRKGVVSILRENETIHVAGEAASGKELLEMISHAPPQVALVDLRMPDGDGYYVLENVKTTYPDLKTIVISMYDDDGTILKSVESGANGFLSKFADPHEIFTAIDSVVETGIYFNERTNKALVNQLMKRKKIAPMVLKNEIKLSEREVEIIQLICKEFTNEEIGKRVFLSPRTIEGIRQRLILKVGARNVIGLIVFAASKGLI